MAPHISASVGFFIFFSPIVAGFRRPFDLDVIPGFGAVFFGDSFCFGFALYLVLNHYMFCGNLSAARNNQFPGFLWRFVDMCVHFVSFA
jgi:hypothetical protein